MAKTKLPRERRKSVAESSPQGFKDETPKQDVRWMLMDALLSPDFVFLRSFVSGVALVALLGVTFAVLVGASVLWSMNLGLASLGTLLKVVFAPLSFLAVFSGVAFGAARTYSHALAEWSSDVPVMAQVVFVAAGLGAAAWAFRRGRRVEHETGARLRGLALTSLTVLLYFTLGLEAYVILFDALG